MDQSEKKYKCTLTLYGLSEHNVKNIINALSLPAGTATSAVSDSHIIYMTLYAQSESALDRAFDTVRESPLSYHMADGEVLTLEQAAVYFLKKGGLTLSMAESCTGGLCAARIVNVAGASEVFLGSVVSYANSAKEGILKVSPITLREQGAVSAETVCQMAQGARESFGSDIAISVSGIAGPSGGTPAKPVGTVYFGMASRLGVSFQRANLSDIGRERIRERSVELMLERVIELAIAQTKK